MSRVQRDKRLVHLHTLRVVSMNMGLECRCRLVSRRIDPTTSLSLSAMPFMPATDKGHTGPDERGCDEGREPIDNLRIRIRTMISA